MAEPPSPPNSPISIGSPSRSAPPSPTASDNAPNTPPTSTPTTPQKPPKVKVTKVKSLKHYKTHAADPYPKVQVKRTASRYALVTINEVWGTSYNDLHELRDRFAAGISTLCEYAVGQIEEGAHGM